MDDKYYLLSDENKYFRVNNFLSPIIIYRLIKKI